MGVSGPRSVHWKCSRKLEKGVSRSIFEDSLDILFKKGYREAKERGSGE